MSVKIIATDLDGTLMSPDHINITQRTKKALESAHNKGIKLAISTGRPMCIITDVIEQIPFVDYVINSNGACVYDLHEKRNIYESFIPNDIACELIDFILGYEVFFDVSFNGESHYQQGLEKYFYNMIFPSEFVESVGASMNPHCDLKAFLNGRGIEKITLYTVKDEDFDELWDKLNSYDLFVANSFKGNIEATSSSADKGKALAGICEHMGIEPEEAMAFGDAGNDSPMLRFAGYSFAMENGTPECKSSAKHIAKSNAADGVAIEIEKYCL